MKTTPKNAASKPVKTTAATSSARASSKPATAKAAAAKSSSAKPAAKAALKSPSKAVATPPAKVPAKSSVKAAPAKPVAKTSAKALSKPAAKADTKAKAETKPAAKSSAAAKPTPVKASPAKPAPAKSAPTKTSVKPAPAAKAPAPAATKPVVPAKPVAAAPVTPKPATPRNTKSARSAALVVPSMPQAVASTAAKASYFPSMPSTVLNVPVPTPLKKDAKLANNWKTKPLDQLTDADVIAMSDDEYMNDVQMAFFRRKLVQLKQDILTNAGETTEHLREDTVVVPDPADRATIEEEHALELRTRDRERKLLKKIEQSISRIDAGDYGFCDETGEPIGVGRLLARPTATLSLEAQQRRELKQKMFGD